MITLVSLTQGNPIALKRTVDNVLSSFEGLVNDVVVGDLCVFQEDSKEINTIYANTGTPYRTIPLPFNFIFEHGFGHTLNNIASFAKNDLILYMNVSEVVEANMKIDLLKGNYNCFNFNHATDPHQWTRLYHKGRLQWSGRIHEEVIGDRNLCPSVLFQMADTEKDSTDEFKSNVYNDIKELVYFNQYLKLVDNPSDRGATNEGWVKWAKDNYEHLKTRLEAKGERYNAMKECDLSKYLSNCQEFGEFKNSNLIHFQ